MADKLVEQLLRAIFETGGIRFDHIQFFRWRSTLDDPVVRPIVTVEDMLFELRDGRFQLNLSSVSIEGLDPEPTLIGNLDIGFTLENGQCNLDFVFSDEESYPKEYEEPDAASIGERLKERFNRINEKVTGVVNLVKMINELLDKVKDMT